MSHMHTHTISLSVNCDAMFIFTIIMCRKCVKHRVHRQLDVRFIPLILKILNFCDHNVETVVLQSLVCLFFFAIVETLYEIHLINVYLICKIFMVLQCLHNCNLHLVYYRNILVVNNSSLQKVNIL